MYKPAYPSDLRNRKPPKVVRQLRLPIFNEQVALFRAQYVSVVGTPNYKKVVERYPHNYRHLKQVKPPFQRGQNVIRQVQLPLVQLTGATVRRARVTHPFARQKLN